MENMENKENETTERSEVAAPKKSPLAMARLVLGIVSVVLSLFVLMQSCAAGVSNVLEANGASSGTAGMMVAVMMVAGGIVGICTRKSWKKGGPIACTILYWIGALCTVGTGATYGDLPIWGEISVAFGLVFAISAWKIGNENRNV